MNDTCFSSTLFPHPLPPPTCTYSYSTLLPITHFLFTLPSALVPSCPILSSMFFSPLLSLPIPFQPLSLQLYISFFSHLYFSNFTSAPFCLHFTPSLSYYLHWSAAQTLLACIHLTLANSCHTLPLTSLYQFLLLYSISLWKGPYPKWRLASISLLRLDKAVVVTWRCKTIEMSRNVCAKCSD